ncbi:Isochorismatase-like protein [Rhexocercosporidium sp. MPI-PUGE-AT-0058]|nr:Isochorismatase-like protein [Rhexocercosporidium sp. MPI-PUGE-AT-0058]
MSSSSPPTTSSSPTTPSSPTNSSPPITSTSALVIIDVQNEFLDPEGNFPISATVRPTLLSNLTTLIPRFRASGGHIIWVQAIYANRAVEPAIMAAQDKGDGIVGNNAWLVAATHVFSIPCCEEKTWGSNIHPEIFALSEKEDVIVIKHGYSAYWGGNKGLSDAFKEKGVEDAYFCGVASGTCVLATIVDTVRRGEVRVHALPDCMGWRRENTHVEAVKRFEELGVDVVAGDRI